MQNKIILVVEDNPDEQELLYLACEYSGVNCELVMVDSGVEALDYLFKTDSSTPINYKPMPDLILLDLHLPKISGFEVLHYLRNHQLTQKLPIILLTISSNPQDIRKSYDYGCNGFISKPIDFNQFQKKLCQSIYHWLGSH
jgi:CheY-like chemotaxis protein